MQKAAVDILLVWWIDSIVLLGSSSIRVLAFRPAPVAFSTAVLGAQRRQRCLAVFNAGFCIEACSSFLQSGWIRMFKITHSIISGMLLVTTVAAGMAMHASGANAQTPEDAAASSLVPDEEAGADLYGAVCKGCHGVSIAPTLRGIIDRPAASVASFDGYSDALKAKTDLIWTVENLDAFLASPTGFVPGTLMTKELPDAQTRADIIAYLATLPPPRE